MCRSGSSRLADPEIVLRAAIVAVLAVMLASGIAGFLFGVDPLEQLHLFPRCPFHAATGLPCPGCGMTRAFLLISQLRWGEAFAANPAAPFLAAALLWRGFRPRRWKFAEREALSAAALAAVTALWILRVTPL